jgi:hypothetical protein
MGLVRLDVRKYTKETRPGMPMKPETKLLFLCFEFHLKAKSSETKDLSHIQHYFIRPATTLMQNNRKFKIRSQLPIATRLFLSFFFTMSWSICSTRS